MIIECVVSHYKFKCFTCLFFLHLYIMFCRWMEGDALKLPFPDKCFDAVTIGYGLRNVVDRLTAMREIYRVLKPGGYC